MNDVERLMINKLDKIDAKLDKRDDDITNVKSRLSVTETKLWIIFFLLTIAAPIIIGKYFNLCKAEGDSKPKETIQRVYDGDIATVD